VVSFHSYRQEEREACLRLFDDNCPRFFAPNERADYLAFLDRVGGDYRVCKVDTRVVGAFGLVDGRADGEANLNWILLARDAQGMGLGRAVMTEVASQARLRGVTEVLIAASHLSASFFARFGAEERQRIDDGWGPGMHRIDMIWPITPPGN
jgi:GNAT superfamily N-acetyltransferase